MPQLLRRIFLRLIAGSFLVGALAVIEDAEGRILLVRRTYDARRPWALPGGWVKQDEAPDEAVAREVREETGLAISVGPVMGVMPGPYGELVVVYHAWAGDHAPDAVSIEIAEVRFFNRASLPPLDELYAEILSWRGRGGSRSADLS